ncbi:MAG: GTP pyrophosphokinase [Bacteroidales bacterium]
MIAEFISRYEKEFDFYQNLAINVERKLKNELSKSGIRAIVSSRAKSISRLNVKLKSRNGKRKYKSVSDIYSDIIDLAGVRVALYFPGDIKLVEDIIKKNFKIHTIKNFPENENKKIINEYTKVFDGYSATHFRVSLNDDTRYAKNHCVEIQAASVLMHAWSEVEHDLVYKPLQGDLSKEELMILDEINGLVLSGNIALERLQRAGLHRVNGTANKFLNHYDVASYITSNITVDESFFDFRLVFSILKALGLNDVKSMTPVMDKLKHPSTIKSIMNKTNSNNLTICFTYALGDVYHEKVISKLELLSKEFEDVINSSSSEWWEKDNPAHVCLVSLLTNAICKSDQTGKAEKLIPLLGILSFEFTVFGRERVNNSYSNIINLSACSDAEFENIINLISDFYEKLTSINLNKHEINQFLDLCSKFVVGSDSSSKP